MSVEESFARLAASNARRRVAFGLTERRRVLRDLAAALSRHEAAILAALAQDLGKAEAESRLTEILPVRAEIRHALRHLRRWMRPRRVAPMLALLGTSARIRPEPRGTVLIIAPWNYPLGLSIGPLVSALAAGNAAVVKPSELAPATSAVVARVLAELPADLVAVAQGGAETATALLDLPFDHIFFTGSPEVGRVVMAAAAERLIPVTLELGGKSPAIVGPGADIGRAARMIAWGKFVNAGQTCIAPDHVYVPRARMDDLLAALRARIRAMYGKRPDDLARIVNTRHFARLTGLIASARAAGAGVEGGEADEAARILTPTLLTGTTPEMPVSGQEIFGPILPVIPYDSIEDVLTWIEAGPKPLALYVFERDPAMIERLTHATSSGAVGVNVTLAHFMHTGLPFGGVGRSGIGAAHGEWGFRAFSHEKPVLRDRFSALPLLMPPYGRGRSALIRLAQRLFG
ncbi:aldehyde dehydrogenase family protein [Paenirhodobacter sp.]|uniref:aldehyde dehydrogenase family protein n=1 Tax=Paenirhodobacter sp. TaxID=1965326 RepID=UPI003B425D56